MKKKQTLLISATLLAIVTTFAANASGSNSGAGGGFGQTYCELPSGELIFVPWHYCKIKGGKGEATDF